MTTNMSQSVEAYAEHLEEMDHRASRPAPQKFRKTHARVARRRRAVRLSINGRNRSRSTISAQQLAKQAIES